MPARQFVRGWRRHPALAAGIGSGLTFILEDV